MGHKVIVSKQAMQPVGQNTEKKQELSILGFLAGLGLVLLAFLLFVPVRIRVTPKDPDLYASTWVNPDTAKMEAVSLLGVGYPIKDGYSYQAQDASDPTQKRVVIWWKFLGFDEKLACVAPDSFEITYDAPAYAGQRLDASKVHATAVYGSKKVQMDHLDVPEDVIPMATNVTIPVRTPAGITNWKTEVMRPDKLEAAYEGEGNIGDDFLPSDLTLTMHYPDNTTCDVEQFSVPNAPLYLSEPMTLIVSCDYGDTELYMEPKNATGITVTYPEAVHVGDTMDTSKLVMMMGEDAVTEYEVGDPGVIKAQTKLTLSSKFGDGIFVLDPVELTNVEFSFADHSDWLAGTVPELNSVTLSYEDGTQRVLEGEDYTFLQDGKELAAGQQKLWIDYHGLKLSTDVVCVTEDTAKLRNLDFSTQRETVQTFSLSDAELSQLAILSQRLCGNDPLVNAKEASLMANRYGLYGGRKTFFDYIVDCEYWGSDAREYASDDSYTSNEEVTDVFRDVLVNGWRQFPLYVDERTSDDGRIYQRDVHEIEKPNGTKFRYYSTVADLIYGYSEGAYQKIMAADPAELQAVPEVPISDTNGITIE